MSCIHVGLILVCSLYLTQIFIDGEHFPSVHELCVFLKAAKVTLNLNSSGIISIRTKVKTEEIMIHVSLKGNPVCSRSLVSLNHR